MKLLKWFWNHKIVSAILVIVSIVLFWNFFVKNGNGQFETATVERGTVTEELILSGSIVADEHAYLRFPASGKLSYVGVTEGEQVVRGQLLGKMDTTLLNSAYEQAKSALRAAEANVDAVHDSVKDNDSTETFDERNTRTTAETTKDRAYEAFVQAEYNLRNSSIYAPFAGLVITVGHPFAGVNVLPTETMFELLNPETMYFSVTADQTEINQIALGDKVYIELDAADGVELTGAVSYISFAPIQGEVGSVYSIKVSLDNLGTGDFDYRVGMTGDAHFVLNKKDDVLYVPTTFIQRTGDTNTLLIDDGKDSISVTIGLEGEDNVEVSGEGITEGLTIYD